MRRAPTAPVHRRDDIRRLAHEPVVVQELHVVFVLAHEAFFGVDVGRAHVRGQVHPSGLAALAAEDFHAVLALLAPIELPAIGRAHDLERGLQLVAVDGALRADPLAILTDVGLVIGVGLGVGNLGAALLEVDFYPILALLGFLGSGLVRVLFFLEGLENGGIRVVHPRHVGG